VYWFFWPAGILGLIALKPPAHSARLTLAYVAGLHTLVWAGSLLLFPSHQNINCSAQPCFGGFWPQSVLGYRWAFAASLLVAQFAGLWALRFFPKLPRAKKRQGQWAHAMLSIAAVCLVAVVWSSVGYFRSAHFRCAPPFEDTQVRVGCGYISDWGPDKMMLSYSVFNKGRAPRFCDSQIVLNGESQALHEGIWAEPGKKTDVWVVVPRPEQDTTARLLARCRD